MGFITAAIIVGTTALVGSAVAANQADKAGKRSGRRASRAQDKIDELEANRQAIINPFSGMSNLSDMISNPMANLQVATEAAEFQAEESDIALANTLDTVRQTGMGAGGATALANAALRSKRGIGAAIAQQEAGNNMARAQGEANAQTMRFNEARRMQSMDARGKQYMFETQENRDVAQLDRLAGIQTGNQQNQYAAEAQHTQILGQAIPNAVNSASQFYMMANMPTGTA